MHSITTLVKGLKRIEIDLSKLSVAWNMDHYYNKVCNIFTFTHPMCSHACSAHREFIESTLVQLFLLIQVNNITSAIKKSNVKN